MTQSRLTINVNCSYVRDWNKTLDFLRRLDPVAVVAVIDNLSNRSRILEIQHALPYAKVIARCIIIVKNPDGSDKELDGGMHLAPEAPGDTNHYIISPANFLNTWGMLGKGGLSLSYMNEPVITKAQPADITRQVEHILETIKLATQDGISLVIGNWGVGHQLTEQFDDVINAVGNQRDLHSLGVHAYAPVDLAKCLEVIVARCKARNLAKPRISITEWGYDTSGPGDPLNGYKTRLDQSGVKFASFAIDTFQNIYLPYIEGGWLEFFAVFGWGYAARFPSFDVETDADWQATILDAATKGLLSVTITPPPDYTPPVLEKGAQYTLVIKGAYRNLRNKPGLGTGVLAGQVNAGAVVVALEQMLKEGDYWWHIQVDGLDGWISLDGGAVEMRKVVSPVIITPPPAPKTGYVPTPAQIATLESWRKQIIDSIAAETAKLAIVESILATIKTGV